MLGPVESKELNSVLCSQSRIPLPQRMSSCSSFQGWRRGMGTNPRVRQEGQLLFSARQRRKPSTQFLCPTGLSLGVPPTPAQSFPLQWD